MVYRFVEELVRWAALVLLVVAFLLLAIPAASVALLSSGIAVGVGTVFRRGSHADVPTRLTVRKWLQEPEPHLGKAWFGD